jgi:hypothetical protein
MALQKHLLNDADTLVVDSLTGLCAVNNQLSFDPPNKGKEGSLLFSMSNVGRSGVQDQVGPLQGWAERVYPHNGVLNVSRLR